MGFAPFLAEAELSELRQLSTCMVANAIETFSVRLRNTGFTDGKLRCMFPDNSPMVGYAVTARLRTDDPPISGNHFHDRGELWNRILQSPPPRILVLEDMDHTPGKGAFIGDMHAAILRALGCVGYVTNGAVRELPRVRDLGIQLFSGNIGVSHAYAHIFDIGASLKIDGMEVRTGSLLHGDQHGIVNIPPEVARQVPQVVRRLQQKEQEVIQFCQSSEFSIEKLNEVMKHTQ